MTVTTAFSIDEDYDVTRASDGLSRFGAYVRQRAGALVGEVDDLTDEGDRRVAWAVAVWPIARPPVMTPGYVRSHPRVLSDQVVHSYHDGSLVATVELATPWPQRLAASPAWRGNTVWRDWPRLDGSELYVPPSEVGATRPHLTASARLHFPLPAVELPPAPHELADDLTGHARAAVTGLVSLLNRVVSSAIAALDGDAR